MKSATRALLLVLVLAAGLAPVPAAPGQKSKARPVTLDPAAVKAIEEMGPALAQLETGHQKLMQAVGELEGLYTKLAEKAGQVAKLAAEARKAKSKGQTADKLYQATVEMQEMQMSFNLQYLQLQNQISQENRQFSMVSNIMKNKHDTAKNSIDNIR